MKSEKKIREKLEDFELCAKSLHTMPEDVKAATQKGLAILKWVLDDSDES